MGIRQRQHARLLRGGVKDDRAGDGGAAGLARPRPGDRADRLRLALHEDPAGLRGRPLSGAAGRWPGSGHARLPGRRLRAGGVTAGGLRKLAERGDIGAGETVVVYITGDGLKTIDAVRPAVRTIAVSPDPDDVDAALERRLA